MKFITTLLTIALVLTSACSEKTTKNNTVKKTHHSFTRLSFKNIAIDRKTESVTYLAEENSEQQAELLNLVFHVETTRPVKFASIGLGYLPNPDSLYPVFRHSEKTFPESTIFDISLPMHRLKSQYGKDCIFKHVSPHLATHIKGETLVFYKLYLIDENGDSETYESRVLVDENLDIKPTVVYGPYLDRNEHDEYIISFEMDRESPASLIFDNKTISSKTNIRKHMFKLGKLTPGNHTYSIKGFPRTFTFTVNTSPVTKFVVMSDCRETSLGFDYNFQAVNGDTLRRAMLGAWHEKPDFIVVPGDLVSGYTTDVDEFRRELKSFAFCTEPVSSMVPVFEGMGNHEAVMDMTQRCLTDAKDKLPPFSSEDIFAEVFVNPENGIFSEKEGLPPYKENVYTFSVKGNLFIMLNSNYWWTEIPEEHGGNLEGYIMDKQMEWLKNVLEANRKKYKEIIVFTHEPAYPVSSHMKDGMWYNGGVPDKNGGYDRSYIVKRRNEFITLLGQYHIKLLFFGDEHNYSRVLIDKQIADVENPITQIITGGAGAPFYEKHNHIPWKNNVKAFSKENHFVVVEIDNEIRVKVVSVHGITCDSFTIN